MSNKIFIGQDLASLDFSPDFLPISKVIAKRSSGTWFESGDDTGRTLEFTNPWATQAMADSVLSQMKGFVYKPFSGQDAVYPIYAEMGDGITIGGKYSFLATSDIDYNSLTTADISAPEDEELDHEYPFKTTSQKEAERENKRIYSLITKTDEEIRLYVANEIDGVESEIKQTADSITAQVSSLDGRLSSLSLDLDGIRGEVQDVSGNYASLALTVDGLEITTNGLSSGTTTINGACIKTGQISADRIDVSELVAEQIGGGYVALIDSSGRTVGTFFIGSSSSAMSGQGVQINAPAIALVASAGDVFLTSRGEATYVHVSTDEVTCKGSFAPNASGMWNLGGSNRKWDAVYATTGEIQTSDREQKTDISYGLNSYAALFDALKPCVYRYKNGGKRLHIGMISQDVEQSMIDTGVSDMDFAGFIKSPTEDGGYDYSLRYSEFIPLLVEQVQKLKGRVAKLEAKP